MISRKQISISPETRIPFAVVPITIHMLLHHTSGVGDYLTLANLAGLRAACRSGGAPQIPLSSFGP